MDYDTIGNSRCSTKFKLEKQITDAKQRLNEVRAEIEQIEAEIEDTRLKQKELNKDSVLYNDQSTEMNNPDDNVHHEVGGDPVLEWLQMRGFSDNPFMTTSAEQEEEAGLLQRFFVRTELFHTMSGDPSRPQSRILFAGRGHGKTSYRLAVADYVSKQEVFVKPALVINFKFDSVLRSDQIDNPDDKNVLYIRESIEKKLTKETLETLTTRMSRYQRQNLEADEMLFATFCALKEIFASPEYREEDLPDDTSKWVDYYNNALLGLEERLDQLSKIVRQSGFASVYVLLDGVDQLAVTPGTQILLLRVLLDSNSILHGRGFAFKFLLPIDLKRLMEKGKVRSFDWIPIHPLDWQVDELRKVLAQRLENSDDEIKNFSDLCDADFDDEILNAASKSPRRLIKIARSVLEEHCNYLEDFTDRISEEAIRKGMSKIDE